MRLQTSRRAFNRLLLSTGAACTLENPLRAETPLGEFAHPGMLHSAADLERMRTAVKLKSEPTYSGFQTLQAHPGSQKSYVGKGAFAEVARNPTVHADEFNKDCNAAYQCAVMWKVTGDRGYFAVSSRILNDWSKILKSIGGVDAILCAGLGPFLMANAAELLRDGNAWNAAESERFGRMLLQVVLPVIHNFAAFANGNWDTAAIKTMMAIAIYTDDRTLFERATDYYCHGCGDGRLQNYIYPSGQCQESGRDQQHTQLGLAHLGDCCEMAWNQGVDLYGWMDNRLLAGFEYTARYNLGEEVPFQPDVDRTGKYRHAVISPRGNLRPVYEQIYNHYTHRRGLAATFTGRAAEKVRPEGAGFQADQTGFGTLLYTRPPEKSIPPGGVPAGLRAATGEEGTSISFVRPAATSTVTIQRAERPRGPFISISSQLTETSFQDSSVKRSQLYVYRAIDNSTRRTSSPVAHMAGLPKGWRQACLGAFRGKPAAAFDGEAFRLTAAGAASAEERPSGLFFVYRALCPSTSMTVRLNPPVASQFLRTGIVIATTASLPALCAALLVSPTSGPEEHPRWSASLHTATTMRESVALPAPAILNGRIMAPVWLRLQRAGISLNASTSVDGLSWTMVGATVLQAEEVNIGLALDSGLSEVETEVLFDQIAFG